MNGTDSPRFYFALPRFLALLRGGNPRRVEKNGTEAWVVSIAIYLLTYLFFAGFVPPALPRWIGGLALAGIAFLVFVFWIVALHLNSLILKAARTCGLFRALPVRRGQAVLIVTATTVMAFALLQRGAVAGEIAAIWITGVAMNLVAALILAFRNGDGVQSR
jgi:hypothetical protein